MNGRAGTYPLGVSSHGATSGSTLARGGLLLASTIALLVALWQIGQGPSGHGDWPLLVSGACAGWLLVHALASYAAFRSVYLLSSFYAAALLLFHLAAPMVDAVGWLPGQAMSFPDIVPSWLELSAWYVLLALASFGIGQAWGFGRGGVRNARRAMPARVQAFLFRDGIGLLLVSCGLLAWVFATVGNLLAFSRAELFRGVGDTRGLGVFLMVFPSALVLLVFGARAGVVKIAVGALALAGFALIMLSGYRTSAIYPLIVGAILWRKSGRRIPLALAAGGLVMLVLAISFVGVLRQAGPYAAMDRSAVTEAWRQTTPKDTVRLGQTGALLAHVLRLVPEQDGYRYGMTYLESLRQSLPNMSSQIADSPRQAVKRGTFTRATFERLAPSDWLTYRIAPWAFDIGQGVGFTTIGEAYLNFGTPGVVAFFLVLGYVLARLDRIDVATHPYAFLFCAAFSWHLIRTVRDDFSNFTKPALFTVLILAAWRFACWLAGWRVAVPGKRT